MSIVIGKGKLRKEMSLKRNSLDISLKKQMDESICNELLKVITKRNARVVHAYIPIGSEINLLPLISQLLELDVKLICPKTLTNRRLENRELVSLNQLEEGPMKTFHPKEPNIYSDSYDLIIVPGLAFDDQNFRLGYGGGYYDGFLSTHEDAFTVGLFYEFQKVANVPVEEHDLALDHIILPI